MKKRLKDEGNETVTNCNALKMLSPDNKMRLTDVANTEQLLKTFLKLKQRQWQQKKNSQEEHAP